MNNRLVLMLGGERNANNYERALISQANRCADDGIDCERCSQKIPCIQWWDTTVATGRVTRKNHMMLIMTLSQFKRKKNTKA